MWRTGSTGTAPDVGLDYDDLTPEVLAATVAAEIGRETGYRDVETDGAARAAGLLADLLFPARVGPPPVPRSGPVPGAGAAGSTAPADRWPAGCRSDLGQAGLRQQ